MANLPNETGSPRTPTDLPDPIVPMSGMVWNGQQWVPNQGGAPGGVPINPLPSHATTPITSGAMPNVSPSGIVPLANLPAKPSAFASLWHALSTPAGVTAISAGAGLAGSALAAHAATSAANTQAQSARESLDFLKQAYADRQQQLAPFINVGRSSANTLGGLMGLEAPAGGWNTPMPSAPMPGTQTAVPRAPTAATEPANPQAAAEAVQGVFQSPGSAFQHFNQIRSLGTMSGGVRIKAPDGRIGLIPESRVAEALAAGGQRVS